MKRGFYTIMAAQFFSSLADNALFVLAVALLIANHAPEWQGTALVPLFALFYVMLAPLVGAFADALPKGQVMLISNAIKVLGCLLMLIGFNPLGAYAVVGLGAAAYSPAKYGILTELLPHSQLVKANGWIEGLTITSIILGVLLGGILLRPDVAAWVQQWQFLDWGSAEFSAIATTMVLYGIAAAFNLKIPRTSAPLIPLSSNLWLLVTGFWQCNQRLWRDKLGQITLTATTLLWGVSGNLRYVILAWAVVALNYNTSQASILVGVVAIGTALGAVVAASKIRLHQAPRVLALGIGMGVLVMGMVFISDVAWAIPFLTMLGALGGLLIVPMNALLQHRGYLLMGAGRSIAVQNFNEQACILSLGILYTTGTGLGLSVFTALVIFGLLISAVMALVWFWYRYNLRRHAPTMRRLLAIASDDNKHPARPE